MIERSFFDTFGRSLMAKTFLYRLFGYGKLPPYTRRQLEHEGIVLRDEGISGSATYRNFRSPR